METSNEKPLPAELICRQFTPDEPIADELLEEFAAWQQIRDEALQLVEDSDT